MIAIALLLASAHAFSPPAALSPQRRTVARAAKPVDIAKIYRDTLARHQPGAYAASAIKKRRVAVCGAGGSAGAVVYGAVQRAAQCFDAGLCAPRALVGAARGSRSLNSVLATSYVLAFAGEDLVRRCDFREPEKIEKALADCATVVVPCRLRPQGAVTGTEWYWDLDFAGDFEPFERVVAAAPEGAHVVCVAGSADAAAAESVLAASGAAHTLLVVGELESTPRWNLNKGVVQTVGARSGGGSAGDLQAEDLGAVIAQAVSVLDPAASRVLSLGVVAEGSGDQVALHAAINSALLGS